MLRAIAAIMVVIDHVFSRVEGLHPGTTILSESQYHLLGEIGVQIFFCISGFIMVYTTNSAGNIKASLNFLKKRIVRVYPIYIITLLAFVFVVKYYAQKYNINFWVDISSENILKRLFLMPTFTYGNGWNNILLQSWTLVYEIYFYSVFALSMCFFKQNKVPFVSSIFIVLLMFLSNSFFTQEDSHTSTYAANVIGSENLMFFIVGSMIGSVEKTGFLASVSIKNTGVFVLSAIFLISSSFIWRGYLTVHGVNLAIVALLILSTKTEIENKRKFNRSVVYLGAASYSIYLIHIFMFISAPFFNIYNIQNNLYCLIMVAVAVAMGCVFHSAIEKPITKILNTKLFLLPTTKKAL